MLQQGDGLLPLRGGYRRIGRIGRIEQVHQGCGQLLRRSALGLALEGMPLVVVDREQSMQGLRRFSAAFRPRLTG